jgi:hypothetical protein
MPHAGLVMPASGWSRLPAPSGTAAPEESNAVHKLFPLEIPGVSVTALVMALATALQHNK